MFPSNLLLSKTRIEAMGDGFIEKQAQTDNFGSVLILFGAVLAVMLLFFLYRLIGKIRSKRKINDPKKLFNEVGRAHGLSWGQIRTLRHLAKVRQLKDPIQVFLNSEIWRIDPKRDQKFCRPRMRKKLQMLQRIIFNMPEENGEPA